jgi:flagellar hook protein FlgE
MLRSMYSGISGMKNFQTKLDVIGNNIANVNTYGFKKGRTTFKDLVSQQIAGASSSQENRGGTNPIQVGIGSTLGSIDTIHTQGSLQTSGRLLDLGLSGDGFFVVNNGSSNYYTRAGNFYLDELGRLVTGDGNLVQGYGVNEDGSLKTTLSSVKIDSSSFMPPKPTDEVKLNGNLDSNTETGKTRILNYTVKDSLGNNHDLVVEFTKGTGLNEWSFDVFNADDYKAAMESKGQLQPTSLLDPSVGDNVLNFGTDGKLVELPEGEYYQQITFDPSTINPTNGADQVTFDFDFNNITQVSAANTVAVSEMSGYSEGYLESFNIGPYGEVIGVYTNGEVNTLSQLAIATFSNNGALTKAGNNLFQASNNSGIPNIGIPGNGRGTITAGALEMSNVDLSEEFTEMITAQRGFQANTRIITTSDEILQELVNLKR